MLKKTLLLLGVVSFALPSMAMEISNPFYTPDKGSLSSVTSLSTARSQYKDNEYKEHVYGTALTEELGFGITDSFALSGSIGNTWQKNKILGEGSGKDNSNIDFTVGGIYNILYQGPTKLQVKAHYGQKETKSHENKGAYKYARAGVKAGYDLYYFLPYVSAEIEVPVAQSKEGNDKNTYNTRLGAYRLFCNKLAVDAGVAYNHVEKYEQSDWTVDAEVSYFLTPKVTAGVFASYMIDGKLKHDVDLSDRKIGLRLRAAF